jgi:hypothetical protein
MVSGIVVGILKEQHSDHIVLADASRVPFPDGLVPEHLPSGSSVTILYSRDGAGEMVVRASPVAPCRTYVTFLRLPSPTVADGATRTRGNSPDRRRSAAPAQSDLCRL